jgi:hypothetical protein
LAELLAQEKKYLQPDNPLIATTRFTLAGVLRDLREPDRARHQFQKVLDGQLGKFRGSRLSVLQIRYELALACRDGQDEPEAQRHLEDILAIIEREARPENEFSQRVRVTLAKLLAKQGKLEPAGQILESVLAWRHRAFPPDDPETLSIERTLDRLRSTAAPTPTELDRLAAAVIQILLDEAAQPRETLRELFDAKLSDDPGWQQFRQQFSFSEEGHTPQIQPKIKKWAEFSIGDALEDNPDLCQHIARQVKDVIQLPGDDVAAVSRRQLQVLVVAEEWFSVHGGISSFNRGLCTALAAIGVRVTCFVPSADDKEKTDARRCAVDLVDGDPEPA